MIKKIISGGQTGADQAGLDVAIELGIPHGGWIPKRRLTEAGILPQKYKLKEMATASDPKRVENNILDADGTVIFTCGPLDAESAHTCKLSTLHGFSCLHIDLKQLDTAQAVARVRSWIVANKIKVIHVAGSRATKDPEICALTRSILTSALGHLK